MIEKVLYSGLCFYYGGKLRNLIQTESIEGMYTDELHCIEPHRYFDYEWGFINWVEDS